MPAQVDTTVRDATPLYDAARSLHGYFLFRWMREYLNVVLGNIHRWWRAGLLGADGRPNAAFRVPGGLQRLRPRDPGPAVRAVFLHPRQP
jgi:hypothetical protein